MKLIEIDKKTYRTKLNQVIVGFIVTLAVLAVTFGAILIALFADILAVDIVNSAIEQGETTSNFRYNFLGVLLALLVCGVILQQLKHKPFFNEIYYVWQIKQIQNIIYRRLKKIKQASVVGDANAIIILRFYYASLEQLYTLDDNTLTMSSLKKDMAKLATQFMKRVVDILEKENAGLQRILIEKSNHNNLFMKKILIIGGGAMGSAFSVPCIDNNNKVLITEPYNQRFIKNLSSKNKFHSGLKINLSKKLIFKKYSKKLFLEKYSLSSW